MGMSDNENGYEMKRHSQVNTRDICSCSAGSRVTKEGKTNWKDKFWVIYERLKERYHKKSSLEQIDEK